MTRAQLKDSMYLNSNIKYAPERRSMNFNLRAKLFSIIYTDTIHTDSDESSRAPDIDRSTGCHAVDSERYLYRLGDFYNYVTHCDSMSNLEWMVEAFPGSLLSMFIQSIDISDNIDTRERKFLNLIKSRLSSPDTIAQLHLRTGDVLSISRHVGKEWRMYTPIKKFHEVADRLIELDCDSITIYSGTHENLGTRDSQVEVHLDEIVDEMYMIGDIFTCRGIKTQFRSSDADSDLLDMMSGDIFIPTQGEYSALIAKYADSLDKIVIMNARE